MIKDKVQEALNSQLNAEIYSAYLYMSMSAYFKSVNLDGFAVWMHEQSLEELGHAKKFYDFVNQRGGRVILTAIEGPKTVWASSREAFEDALKHEQYVTGRINDLVDIALAEKDHATNIFLQWFVTEQIEEEDNVGGVVEKLKMLEDTKGGMFMLDRELGQRGAGASEGEEESS